MRAKSCSGLRIRKTASILIALTGVLIAAGTRASAQAYSVLYNFGSQNNNPAFPAGGLVQDVSGNLYGTAEDSSAYSANTYGAIWKLTPNGTFSVLHAFALSDGVSDGLIPYNLILGADGNLYGTAPGGGISSGICSPPLLTIGCGTVFELNLNGNYSVLYTFDGTNSGIPTGLIQGADGNFYGTTWLGGEKLSDGPTTGLVFAITPQGAYSNLYNLDPTNGFTPTVPLVQANDGTFYGTTTQGGTNGTGSVFSFTAGGLLAFLFDIPSIFGASGGPLVLGRDGSLYGALDNTYGTYTNPCLSQCGEIYRLTTSGNYSSLYSFPEANNSSYLFGAAYPNGSQPGVLIQGGDGNFYGVASDGLSLGPGPCNNVGCGLIYKLTPSGAFSVLFQFDGSNGTNPTTLLWGINGVLYGTAMQGGSSNANLPACAYGNGCGLIFSLDPTKVVDDFILSPLTFFPLGPISPGAEASAQVTVEAIGGFNSNVAFTCSVQPGGSGAPACSVTPASAAPATSVTVNLNTMVGAVQLMPLGRVHALTYAVWMPLFGLAVVSLCFASGRPRNQNTLAVCLAALLAIGVLSETACGGGSGNSSGSGNNSGGGPTAAGTYTVTITGTAGSLQHSTAAIVTVQ